ncbi:hypothetical protein MNBD_GAMMA12-1978 [hydrothermal vent metagenome]|uniref:Radical SAM core domain-containing protein n=1 Tax=hydrothermal vent metagenome TaxID=652676 RepID=A0A3B0Z398_9ZZZZ
MGAIDASSIVLRETTSLCSVCKQGISAQIVERNNKIYMQKTCATHGNQTVLIEADAAWYHNTLSFPAELKAPAFVKNKVENGCPFDCGACESHEQAVYLPVVPITSACNLDCPICYTINKNDDAYFMSLDEFAKTLEVIRANDPNLKIINFTGGEPTLHPQLPDIIRLCHKAGIHRTTISTHGLTFLKNEPLLAELASLNARMVLSFDSFDDATNYKMLGANTFKAKMKVIDLFEKYSIDTTLIPVIALGINDHELGDFVQLMLTRDCIRSLEIHTMTFTGQGGKGFEQGGRITTSDVIKQIEQSSDGKIALSDFVPSPCAHPMCYQTCYLLDTGEQGYVPFTRFMEIPLIRELLTDNLYMEPGEKMERIFQETINQIWASSLESEVSDAVMKAIKNNIQSLFPGHPLSYREQQTISEHAAKTIYIHSHMDEDTFDVDRIRQCCVGVPATDGGNIPTCAYNIHYRGRDDRFSKVQYLPLSELTGGMKNSEDSP